MENNIVYRLADDKDIPGINSLYLSSYNRERTTEQFVWEYNSAPAGRAIYVVAELNGKIIGSQCVIPYYCITRDNRKILTGKSEDTLVSHDQRGKGIFENMYKLLIEECEKRDIQFVWGFTYATKPFIKIGFEVPFAASMLLSALKPLEASRYFSSLSRDKSQISRIKILCMCYWSYSKHILAKYNLNERKVTITQEEISLNSDSFNYLQDQNHFGLNLDKAFLDYRVNNNPYNKSYYCYTWRQNDIVKACIYFNITKDNVGYILHVFFDDSLSRRQASGFIRKCIEETELKSTSVARFWGFTHNSQNLAEVNHLLAAGFIKLNRGISFVFKKIKPNFNFDINHFVLSRMASQGTD
jgi:hypothetical protein